MTIRHSATRVLRGGFLAVTLVVAAACGSDSSAGNAEAASVDVAVFRYQPPTLQVTAGTTLTWRNRDEILHTVTAGVPGQPSGEFDEELSGKGATASITLDRPGTYTYFCTRHPEAMRGAVTVV